MNMRRPVLPPRTRLPKRLRMFAASRRSGRDCRSQFAGKGLFLFGEFGAADAMYAPIVSRFHTYDIAVSTICRGYMDAVMALPAWGEWHAGALAETGVLAEDEVDWPIVLSA